MTIHNPIVFGPDQQGIELKLYQQLSINQTNKKGWALMDEPVLYQYLELLQDL